MKQDRSGRFLLLSKSVDISRPRRLARVIRLDLAAAALLLSAHMLASKPAQHVRKSIVSDWAQRYVRYPDSKDESVLAVYRKDPRWEQGWYARHRDAWWPEFRHEREHGHQPQAEPLQRDWSVALGVAPSSTVINFSFTINSTPVETAFGSVNVTDQGGGKWLATSGSLTVTGGSDVGTWTLIAGGPGMVTSPNGAFNYDNLITPAANPVLDTGGLLFGITGNKELNVWGTGASTYSFYDCTAAGTCGTRISGVTGNFTFQPAPGGGQTTPAKYTFDVNATPSCANDFVAVGIASTPASGGQANIVGVNNLYSTGGGALCSTGPSIKFAYASGTGQVPASLAISLGGTQLAYVENLTSGSSYFHVLTIGTTGSNGASATAAVSPSGGNAGVGGATNNAVDNRVLLSPDGGGTNQSSTSAPFISYTDNDVADTAYVTTYTNSGGGSGYLYKIGNVFTSSAPTILWKVSINAIPGPPVYSTVSNSVFFTDGNGRIDYVYDNGTSPTVTYGGVVAAGTTSLNPVTIDIAKSFVYATFNTNGTNALVVQAATTLASSVSVTVGTGNTTYSGPYGVDFNNEWYTGTGAAPPLLFVVGTGSGTSPTLYAVGFGSGGVLNGTTANSVALTSAAGADASPPTEFYNPNIGGGTDYLFVGVTNHCAATRFGGTAGCVMSLTLPNTGTGYPTITPTGGSATIAIAAAGGSTEIVIDNESTATQASSVYYGTKTGSTLVKATQSALK